LNPSIKARPQKRKRPHPHLLMLPLRRIAIEFRPLAQPYLEFIRGYDDVRSASVVSLK
jgi:hypothetical protein